MQGYRWFSVVDSADLRWVEPNDPLENLDHLPRAVTSTSKQMDKLCVYPVGFKSFHGKKGKFLN
ncbi:hypothetical protein RMB13_02115 [Acinetobacter sp. V102_4]|nr:hypothetical protein [Acinetobacter sp. V102_4]